MLLPAVMNVSVAVVDDHEIVREGIARLIDAVPEMQVVAHAADADTLIRMAGSCVPRVLLVDADLTEFDPFVAMQRVGQWWPGVGRILMGERLSDELIDRAFRAGVEGMVDKHDTFESVCRAIVTVASEGHFFPGVARERTAAGGRSRVGRGSRPRELPSLTCRERQIVQLLAEGSTVKEIARRLERSAGTIDKHKTNLMRKLGVHSRVQLARYAIREGFVRL